MLWTQHCCWVSELAVQSVCVWEPSRPWWYCWVQSRDDNGWMDGEILWCFQGCLHFGSKWIIQHSHLVGNKLGLLKYIYIKQKQYLPWVWAKHKVTHFFLIIQTYKFLRFTKWTENHLDYSNEVWIFFLSACSRRKNHNQSLSRLLASESLFSTILLRKDVLQSNLRTVRLLRRENETCFFLPFLKRNTRKKRCISH